jgi:hypothetical protein
MSINGQTTSLVLAAVLLAATSLFADTITGARAQNTYPSVRGVAPKADQPAMTVDEQSKLKKELNRARDRQNSQLKVRGGEARSSGPKTQ